MFALMLICLLSCQDMSLKGQHRMCVPEKSSEFALALDLSSLKLDEYFFVTGATGLIQWSRMIDESFVHDEPWKKCKLLLI